MKFQVLVADQRMASGRLYPLKVIEAAFRQAAPRVLARLVTAHRCVPPGVPLTLDNCVGIVNKLELEGNHALASIEFLPNMAGTRARIEASNKEISFSLKGNGLVSEIGCVSDYELTCIIASPCSTVCEEQFDQSPAH